MDPQSAGLGALITGVLTAGAVAINRIFGDPKSTNKPWLYTGRPWPWSRQADKTPDKFLPQKRSNRCGN